MTSAQMRRQWKSFDAKFNNLGNEKLGMTPEGASVLAQACIEFEQDNTKGFRPLDAGTPPCAGGVVNILSEFSGCENFWNVDWNLLRAQVTKDACDYVSKHAAVFSLLNGLI